MAHDAALIPIRPIRLPSRIGRLSDRTLWLSFALSVAVHGLAALALGRHLVLPEFDGAVRVEVGRDALEMEIGAAYLAADLRVEPPPQAPESRFTGLRPDAERESALPKGPAPGDHVVGNLADDLTPRDVIEPLPADHALGERSAPDRAPDNVEPEIPDLTVAALDDTVITATAPPETRFEDPAPPDPADPEAKPLPQDALLAAAVLPDPGHWLAETRLPVAAARPRAVSAPRRSAAPAAPPSATPLYAATPLPLPVSRGAAAVDPARAEIRFTSFQPRARSRQPLTRPPVGAAEVQAVIHGILPALGLSPAALDPADPAAPARRRRAGEDPSGPPEVRRPGVAALSRLAPVSRWSGGAVQGLRAPATVIGYFHPVYPAASRRRGEQGTAVVAVKINIHGTADEIRLVRSTGFRALDESAVQAAWRARYQPEIIGGLPVTAVQRFDISFLVVGTGL